MFTTKESLLIAAVVLYILANIVVGIWAARRVKNSADYVVAGHRLPLYMVIATVFATWFGSETLLGTSSTFVKEGLGGIVADPFGAALCLILVGLFFAKPLYRLKLLTIGDYYKLRYGRDIEIATSVVIIISYLGWVAAQFTALGVVFNSISHGLVSLNTGIYIGAAIVLVYTIFGGMWSVALTDLIQMATIAIGLVIITWVVTGKIDGGAPVVLEQAAAAGKLNFFPELSWAGWLGFFGALFTLGFGSIPQQDVYQRVMSANSEVNAKRGSVIGGVLYLLIAMMPIYLAYTAFMIEPTAVKDALSDGGDPQLVLPTLVMNHTPFIVQIIFFGAVLSAIMSTASATLLAPSSMISENILSRFFKGRDEKYKLNFIRGSVVLFAFCVLLYSLNSSQSIFQMVEEAYKVVLVGAFVPLVFGLYWKRASQNGARLAIVAGVVSWLVFEYLESEFWTMIGLPDAIGVCPPQLAGLIFATLGMLIGSFIWPNQKPLPQPPVDQSASTLQ
ncbi:sodium:solute symporter family protein [Alkanindiges sp. WGS2144]|uniref:sodium:solute symporter family protein n=1 Tax=Alkanindiges sp. WGS2144 TaxID=3366808 RepID=UPI003753156E